MRAWQIAAVGVLGLVLLLLFPHYEAYLAPLCATMIVAAVIAGFLLQPKTEVFYLKTVVTIIRDGELHREKGFVAVRLELVRLWSLFLPTMFGLGCLFGMYAHSGALRLSVLEDYPFLTAYTFLGKYVVAAVIALTLMWVKERVVLRDAALCRAKTMQRDGGYIRYAFTLPDGEWYGGEDWECRSYAPQLSPLIFYRAGRPETSKPALSCWFHKLVVIGNGLTELDEATVESLTTELAPEVA